MYQRLHDLCEVRVCEKPSFVREGVARGKLGKGVKYEAAWHREARKRFGETYTHGTWFRYRRSSSPQVWSYAQIDGLYFDFNRGLITVFEVKFRHTVEAYFQLIDRYLPLMDFWLNDSLRLLKAHESRIWRLAPIEICFWYDKALAYPTPIKLRPEPLEAKPGDFSVHIWKNYERG